MQTKDFLLAKDCYEAKGVLMDYYFPGTGKSGDLPPRKGFAEKWHKRTLAFAPNIELHILVGSYAQRYYLQQKSSVTLTETVKVFNIGKFICLVHCIDIIWEHCTEALYELIK